MFATAYLLIFELSIPLPLEKPGCTNGVKCTIKKGNPYAYLNTFHLDRTYPAISSTVQFELKDEKYQDIVCIEIPVKISECN